MPSSPDRLLVLHDHPEDVLDLFHERLPALPIGCARSPDEVARAVAEHDPTLVFSIKHSDFPGPAHARALEAPALRWFHVGGSGFDHLGRWDAERITVTNSAGVLAPFLAETALAALLSLGVGLPGFAADQRARRWASRRFRPVAGRTLLIVGVGRVGGALAERAAALGMRVLGVRQSELPHPAVERMVGPDALPDLLPEADVVSLHLRLTEATRRLFDADMLARMKPGALLLNSARGAVVDEPALIEALGSGRLGGAWLDVFEREPLPTASPLWALPNVLLTPHCADQVEDFPLRFARHFCELYEAERLGEALPVLGPPE